jgi:hypothetical protein
MIFLKFAQDGALQGNLIGVERKVAIALAGLTIRVISLQVRSANSLERGNGMRLQLGALLGPPLTISLFSLLD